jgi:hypothetical protein
MALAILYPVAGNPLLGQKFLQLDPLEQDPQVLLAEMLLNHTSPAYAGDAGEQLAYANVLQINFQLEKGLTPEIHKSVSQSHPGNTTTFRDRYVSPEAWAIVQRVTKIRVVGFRPPGIGV